MNASSNIEIMAPAGNFECLRAAIQGGANSVYFGVGRLNMRSHSANNFAAEDLGEIVKLCRENNVKTYLTLNIVVYNEDLQDVEQTLQMAKAAGIDAIIASDMAVIQKCREIGLEVHISTQLNVANFEAVKFFAKFADVIVLARELTLPQIKEINKRIAEEKICGPSGKLLRTELFVHGALCMSISGKCYLSLHEYNASANRGSCYQLCRRGYKATDLETGTEINVENKYLMSPKDLCTIEFVDKIVETGVTVFKIEGRARSAEYVRFVTECYRKAADAVEQKSFTPQLAAELKAKLSTLFNRGFWAGYYQGAKLGEWSSVYGSNATRQKEYVAKVTNYFSEIGVAELLIQSGELNVGDNVLIIGPTLGCIEHTVKEIRVDLKPVQKATKGEYCSIPISQTLRRSDKVYLWKEVEQ